MLTIHRMQVDRSMRHALFCPVDVSRSFSAASPAFTPTPTDKDTCSLALASAHQVEPTILQSPLMNRLLLIVSSLIVSFGQRCMHMPPIRSHR